MWVGKQRADGAVDALTPHAARFSPGVNRPAESSDTTPNRKMENMETAAGRPSEPRASPRYVSNRKMTAASSGNALCSGAGGDEDEEGDEGDSTVLVFL